MINIMMPRRGSSVGRVSIKTSHDVQHGVFLDPVEAEDEAGLEVEGAGCDEDAAVSVPIEMDGPIDDVTTGNADGCGLPVAEGGGALSPLSGAYLLIVLAEPISEKHKVKMMQKLRQGKASFPGSD